MEYQNINLENLKPCEIRSIRDSILSKLKDRIESGYNPARPLTVIKNNGDYIVADGNHRLRILNELHITSVPCLIYEDADPYTLAIKCNQDEDTYAPVDLFDWLDIIGKLRADGLTQAQIGERIGWSRSAVSQYFMIQDNVATEVLELAKEHQEGRVASNATNVATSFTEGWFRNSGIYDLVADNQIELIKWFIDSKFPQTKKVSEFAAQLKLKQDSLEYVNNNIVKGADIEQIIDNINKGLYKTYVHVVKAVAKANEQFLDRQKIQILNQDGLEMLKSIPDNSVDCVITDPPYNVTSNSWDQFKSQDDYLSFIESYLKQFKRILKTESNLFMFVDSDYMARIELLLINSGFEIRSRIIWVRKNMSMGRVVHDRFISQWEPIFHCGTKSLSFPNNWGDERGDVQEFAVPQSNFADKKEHPTQKPIELIKRLVSLSTDIGDLVVDPFCGSGTTAAACAELNRKCITSDISADYINIAKMRVFNGK